MEHAAHLMDVCSVEFDGSEGSQGAHVVEPHGWLLVYSEGRQRFHPHGELVVVMVVVVVVVVVVMWLV